MNIANRQRVAAVLLAAAILTSGCQRTMDMLRFRSKPDRTAEELEFEAGANRKPTAKTLYGMARILAAKGQDTQCQILLQRILDEYPEFMPAYCDMAELQMRHGHVRGAIGTLSAAVQRKPTDAVMLNNLGMCYLEQGDHAASLTCFIKAAGAAPGNTRFRANTATALGLLGRYEESLSLYKQILTPPEAHKNLGVLCRARNDRVRAEEEFSLAEALSVTWPNTRDKRN